MSTLLLSVLALVVTGNMFFAHVLIVHALIAFAVVLGYTLVILFVALCMFYEDAVCTLLDK